MKIAKGASYISFVVQQLFLFTAEIDQGSKNPGFLKPNQAVFTGGKLPDAGR